MILKEIYPHKAQYLTGEPVCIQVEYDSQPECKLELLVEVWCGDEKVKDIARTLSDKQTSPISIWIGEFHDSFMGYGVLVKRLEKSIAAETVSTAFDVVKQYNMAIRYGFLSDFYTEEKGSTTDVESLNKYHINYVQFYDWMYRHEDLVPQTEQFKDLMGRTLDLSVVCEKIAACHEKNMQTMAYGAVYAASEAFYNTHQDWGLLSGSGEVYDFIGKLKIMSLAEDIPWHQHIINEYEKAVSICGFDGIHMDTYGAPKWGTTNYNGVCREEYLEKQFPALICNTRKQLEKLDKPISLIFNNVGNWPVDTVALSNQDAVYIEVWDPYNRYSDLSQIITTAQALSNDKPVVIAAYIKPFLQESPSRAETSALLTMAVIAANGGYHLALGEEHGILMQAYYVDYYKMSDRFAARMRSYYDFTVRYCHLFYDKALRDVSKTHCFGDNYEYKPLNFNCSVSGEADSIYTIIRENDNRKIISLINLLGNDNKWNTGKEQPILATGLSFEVCLLKDVKAVYEISPDRPHCQPTALNYITFVRNGNLFLSVQLEQLFHWSSIVIEF